MGWKEMIVIKKNLVLAIILILLISSFSHGQAYERSYRNDLEIEIPVLLYHHIASEEDIEIYSWENNSSVISLENFSQQMELLKDNHYYTASLEELELFIDGDIELPDNTVVITFDDGYLSNIEYAYPIMRDYGFKGSIFMVGETATRDESNLMLGELHHIPALEIHKYEDVFEFGCHTFNMHSKDDEGLALLISSSREEIVEDLDRNYEFFKTRYMAYPYGSYDFDVIDLIEELGYSMGFTVEPGYVTRNSHKFQLPRFPILPRMSIYRFANLINLK